MKIAIVGVTGLVGRTMAKILAERKFPVTGFVPIASLGSVGKEIIFNNKSYKIRSINQCIDDKPGIALFAAGSAVAMEWALKFAKSGTTVIDTSSAWRMHEKVPLVIPEINSHIIKEKDHVIANPNCSTVQMLMAIAPLNKHYKANRIVVTTFQSVTGTGFKAVQQLSNERLGIEGETAYPYNIDLNVIPHGGTFLHTGYTTEEMKLQDETRKILDNDAILITTTVVRVPVFGGHSISVNIEFKEKFDLEEVRVILSETPGVVLQDDTINSVYPMPLYCEGKDDVFVGRLRRDDTRPNALNLWIVTDYLRKGSATNAVQIAEYLMKEFGDTK